MAHIKAPNPITGTHVSLNFVSGEADTDDEWLIHWFKTHRYEVEDNVGIEKKTAKRAQRPRKADLDGEKQP